MQEAPRTPVANPPFMLEGTVNFRTVGGYPAAGGTVRHGALFRSDALHRLTDRALEQFCRHGISRVVDLRSEEERQSFPNILPETVENAPLSLFPQASPYNVARQSALSDVYLQIVRTRGKEFVEAARLIANAPPGGVLVHCTAGKDRTGMVIATVLEAVGVDREQIIVDYVATEANIAGTWVDRQIAIYQERSGFPADDTVMQWISTCPADCLETALEAIDAQWGGVEAMLSAHGANDALFERLRERLIE